MVVNNEPDGVPQPVYLNLLSLSLSLFFFIPINGIDSIDWNIQQDVKEIFLVGNGMYLWDVTWKEWKSSPGSICLHCCLRRKIKVHHKEVRVMETDTLLFKQRVSQDEETEVIITTTFPTRSQFKWSKEVGVMWIIIYYLHIETISTKLLFF